MITFKQFLKEEDENNNCEIIKRNAYGKSWHVMDNNKHRIRFSGDTKKQCKDYCKRHNIIIKEEFLYENKEIPWNGNPKIGWWRDNDHVILYHGTHISRIPDILKNGIKAPSEGPTKGWVSAALDPNTSHGYASMSGESAFRAAGAKAKHIPDNERAVIKLKIPRDYIEKHMNPHMRGNIAWTKDKLTNKNNYDNWKGSDQEYYMMTELRLPDKIPSKFIQGYMRKKK